MTIASALAGLLEVVENDRQARCQALLGEADAQVSALLAAARGESRRHLRAALKAERTQAMAQIDTARAHLQAEQRRAQQRQAALILVSAWALLPPVLLAIWQDEGRRRQWLAAALQGAAAILPRHDWRCQHPATLPAGDVSWLLARAGELGVVGTRCESDAGIDAGLAILIKSDSGDARFDATTAGLLADRAFADGRLLQLLEEA